MPDRLVAIMALSLVKLRLRNFLSLFSDGRR